MAIKLPVDDDDNIEDVPWEDQTIGSPTPSSANTLISRLQQIFSRYPDTQEILRYTAHTQITSRYTADTQILNRYLDTLKIPNSYSYKY
jgi:hypothetical protein